MNDLLVIEVGDRTTIDAPPSPSSIRNIPADPSGLHDPDRVTVGIAKGEHRRHTVHLLHEIVEIDVAESTQPRMLGRDIGSLDADGPATGRAPHRRIEGQTRRRTGRCHLQPTILALGSEAQISANLEAEYA